MLTKNLYTVITTMNVLIIGSSHVRRLEQFLRAKDLAGLNLPDVFVKFYGISGALLSNQAHLDRFESYIRNFRPTIVYVQLGGNDLDSDKSDNPLAEEVGLRLINILRMWQRRYGIGYVVMGQLLCRNSTRHVPAELYNSLVSETNRTLQAELSAVNDVIYWKLKGCKHSQANILSSDGVHLNPLGNYKLYRNIRGAIFVCLKRFKLSIALYMYYSAM